MRSRFFSNSSKSGNPDEAQATDHRKHRYRRIAARSAFFRSRDVLKSLSTVSPSAVSFVLPFTVRLTLRLVRKIVNWRTHVRRNFGQFGTIPGVENQEEFAQGAEGGLVADPQRGSRCRCRSHTQDSYSERIQPRP